MRLPYLLTLSLLATAGAVHALPAPRPAAPPTGLTTSGWSYQLDTDELEKAWSWKTNLNAMGPFEMRYAFHYQNPQDYVLLRVAGDATRATAGFWRIQNGRAQQLGEPAGIIPAPHGQLTVQRSSWRVRALWNGRAITVAYTGLSGAHFGTATRGAVKLTEARMQPVEAPAFEDDFMRAQGPDDTEKPGEWHRVAGVWKTSGLIQPRADAALNPNPFVFRAEVPGSAAGTAVATVGKWFWSDYAVTVSLRPTIENLKQPLVAGVAAYHQADGASVLGLVDFRTGRASLRLGGHTLAVSQPFAASPDQWHRLYLEPGPGTMRLVVDGVERVRVALAGARGGVVPSPLAQGEAALYADLGGGNYADFDDVRVGPNDAISDNFATPAAGRWDDALGQWRDAERKPGASQYFRVKQTAGAGLTLTGDPDRAEGRVEAAFTNIGGETAHPVFGIVFAARDGRNYLVARRRGAALEIVEVASGTGKILASTNVLSATSAAALSVEWSDGVITAHAGATTVTATMASIPGGRVGVWADGSASAAAVTSFNALGAVPRWGEAELPERFQKDNLMENWASNAKAWKLGAYEGGDNRVWWHTGDFFQDTTLDVPLPPLSTGQDVTLLLGADPARPEVGARLTIARDGTGMRLQLVEAAQTVKAVALPDTIADKPHQVRFVRRPVGDGRIVLRVAVDDRVVLAETAGQVGSKNNAVTGTRTGVRVPATVTLDWEKVAATTAHTLDYTFTSAPVDWQSAGGRWEVSERWTCSPQWAFFAGADAVNPTLWSRFALHGDFTLEAYLATPMDQTRGERNPSDLNLTVGGNGRDLASGYSFIFAGSGRSATRVLRGDEVVVNKPFTRPPGKGSDHQDWFYVRVERRQTPQGLRFRYYVNGQQMAEYTDPAPLRGALQAGRIAFWTYNGGLSIARVRLWHSGVEDAPDTLTPQPNAGPALKNALGQWAPRSDGLIETSARLQPSTTNGHEAVQITNPQSGGDWTVYVTRQPFDAAAHPRLSFVYRMPSGVRVNLYAKVDGRWREVIFTGDAAKLPPSIGIPMGRPGLRIGRVVPATPMRALVRPDAIAEGPAPTPEVDTSLTIGTIANVAVDNQWHTATFDLLAALRGASLGTNVEALAFAAPDRDYLRVGLGGNHMGATYWISDFQAPQVRSAVAAAP